MSRISPVKSVDHPTHEVASHALAVMSGDTVPARDRHVPHEHRGLELRVVDTRRLCEGRKPNDRTAVVRTQRNAAVRALDRACRPRSSARRRVRLVLAVVATDGGVAAPPRPAAALRPGIRAAPPKHSPRTARASGSASSPAATCLRNASASARAAPASLNRMAAASYSATAPSMLRSRRP